MWMGMYMCMHVYVPAFTAPSWKAPLACTPPKDRLVSYFLLPTSYFLLPTSYFLLGTVGLHAAGGSSRLLALRVVGVGWVGA